MMNITESSGHPPLILVDGALYYGTQDRVLVHLFTIIPRLHDRALPTSPPEEEEDSPPPFSDERRPVALDYQIQAIAAMDYATARGLGKQLTQIAEAWSRRQTEEEEKEETV